MLVYFASDSSEKWISEFFTHSDAEARHTFADKMGHQIATQMNETQQQEHWNRWLKALLAESFGRCTKAS